MSKDLKENPFAALFASVEDAQQFTEAVNEENVPTNTPSSTDSRREAEVALLEKVLLLTTTDPPPPNFTCILLDNTPPLNMENLDFILFERLLLDDAQFQIMNIKRDPKSKEDDLEYVARSYVVLYLFDVYERCFYLKKAGNPNTEILNKVQSSVLTNLATTLEQPELFRGERPYHQLKHLIVDSFSTSECLPQMLYALLEVNKAEQGIPFQDAFEEVLEEVKTRMEKCSLLAVEWPLLDVLEFFASTKLAPLLMPPTDGRLGVEFQTTLLGSLLSISCLPKRHDQKCEFFENPSSQGMQVHKAVENSIGVAQKALTSRIHKIFLTLLKGPHTVKELLLKWIESCLELNSGRAGLWHIQGDEVRSIAYVSDGFMVNLGTVLLKLASPFTRDILQKDNKNAKILKVDPFYCSPAVAKKRNQIQNLYSGDLWKQTPLIPPKEGNSSAENSYHPSQFSFTTTCFFHTHRALHLGVQVIQQKMHKLSQELGRIQHEFQELSPQGSPAIEMMRKHLEAKTSLFLSYKAAAFETSLVDEMLEFLACSSFWLIQVALMTPNETSLSYKELTLSDLSHESPPSSSSPLRFVPEFIVENLVEAIIAVRRYFSEALSLSGEQLLHYYMSFIASFMGSPHWMNNPHLRAHLAECLEMLIPKDNEMVGIVASVRERLFVDHPLASHLVTAIIHVFVSIEMTGQSVAFEEKFNYRRPMYDVMKYLWSIQEHRDEFVRLAKVALSNMESAKPPLFLRFVNLLMNDAIFLLDEGLSYMSQIRENQAQRETAEWNSLSATQRAERERNVQQMAFLARFHNMLGSRTIQTLVRLTKEIPTMFTHATLIDRMAAMLNHFLTHLVGPKQRNLKVRDMEKYEFKPSEMVGDICSIYIHLSKEPTFSIATSADDRSYSPELFLQACRVLKRIGCYQLSEEIESFGEVVKTASKKRTEEEDLASTAPEEFLDPIMSHLMTDPVRLPSSQIIVDRQTIARHLLSDQTDPFNRQPLTMEEIIPETNLREKIKDWLNGEREKLKENRQKI